MASIFLTGAPIIKTKEQKKVQAIANRMPKRVRDTKKPGPVTVVYRRPDSDIAQAA